MSSIADNHRRLFDKNKKAIITMEMDKCLEGGGISPPEEQLKGSSSGSNMSEFSRMIATDSNFKKQVDEELKKKFRWFLDNRAIIAAKKQENGAITNDTNNITDQNTPPDKDGFRIPNVPGLKRLRTKKLKNISSPKPPDRPIPGRQEEVLHVQDVGATNTIKAVHQKKKCAEKDKACDEDKTCTEEDKPGAEKDKACDEDKTCTEEDKTCAEKDKSGAEKDMTCAEKDMTCAEKDKPDAEKDKPGAEKDKPGAEKDKPGAEKDKACDEDNTCAEKDMTCAEKDKPDAEKDKPDTEKDKPNAEKDKACDEENKICTEEDKACDEEDKTSAEEDKTCAEEDKTSAEKDKTSAEKDKTSAEKDKTSAEKDKTSAEEARTCVEEEQICVKKENTCVEEESRSQTCSELFQKEKLVMTCVTIESQEESADNENDLNDDDDEASDSGSSVVECEPEAEAELVESIVLNPLNVDEDLPNSVESHVSSIVANDSGVLQMVDTQVILPASLLPESDNNARMDSTVNSNDKNLPTISTNSSSEGKKRLADHFDETSAAKRQKVASELGTQKESSSTDNHFTEEVEHLGNEITAHETLANTGLVTNTNSNYPVLSIPEPNDTTPLPTVVVTTSSNITINTCPTATTPNLCPDEASLLQISVQSVGTEAIPNAIIPILSMPRLEPEDSHLTPTALSSTTETANSSEINLEIEKSNLMPPADTITINTDDINSSAVAEKSLAEKASEAPHTTPMETSTENATGDSDVDELPRVWVRTDLFEEDESESPSTETSKEMDSFSNQSSTSENPATLNANQVGLLEDINTAITAALKQAEASVEKLRALAAADSSGTDIAKKVNVLTKIQEDTFKLHESVDASKIVLKIKYKNFPSEPGSQRMSVSQSVDLTVEDLVGYFEVLLEATFLSKRPHVSEKMRGVLVVLITRVIRILGYFMCNNKGHQESDQLFTNVNFFIMAKKELADKYSQPNLSFHMLSFWQCIRGSTQGPSYKMGALYDHNHLGARKFLQRVEKFKLTYERNKAAAQPLQLTGQQTQQTGQQIQLIGQQTSQQIQQIGQQTQQIGQQIQVTGQQIGQQIQLTGQQIGQQIQLTGQQTQLTGQQTQLTGQQTQLTGQQTQLTGQQTQLTGQQTQQTGHQTQSNNPGPSGHVTVQQPAPQQQSQIRQLLQQPQQYRPHPQTGLMAHQMQTPLPVQPFNQNLTQQQAPHISYNQPTHVHGRVGVQAQVPQTVSSQRPVFVQQRQQMINGQQQQLGCAPRNAANASQQQGNSAQQQAYAIQQLAAEQRVQHGTPAQQRRSCPVPEQSRQAHPASNNVQQQFATPVRNTVMQTNSRLTQPHQRPQQIIQQQSYQQQRNAPYQVPAHNAQILQQQILQNSTQRQQVHQNFAHQYRHAQQQQQRSSPSSSALGQQQQHQRSSPSSSVQVQQQQHQRSSPLSSVQVQQQQHQRSSPSSSVQVQQYQQQQLLQQQLQQRTVVPATNPVEDIEVQIIGQRPPSGNSTRTASSPPVILVTCEGRTLSVPYHGSDAVANNVSGVSRTSLSSRSPIQISQPSSLPRVQSQDINSISLESLLSNTPAANRAGSSQRRQESLPTRSNVQAHSMPDLNYMSGVPVMRSSSTNSQHQNQNSVGVQQMTSGGVRNQQYPTLGIHQRQNVVTSVNTTPLQAGMTLVSAGGSRGYSIGEQAPAPVAFNRARLSNERRNSTSPIYSIGSRLSGLLASTPVITAVSSIPVQGALQRPSTGTSSNATASESSRSMIPDINFAQAVANTVYYPDANGNAQVFLREQQRQGRNQNTSYGGNNNLGGARWDQA